MLWFWYSTELKDPLHPGVGVAFVVASLSLRGSSDVTPFLRRSPLAIPAGVYRMGVIRIEHRNAAFTEKQQLQIARMIAEAVQMVRPAGIQIDFDAPRSAWPFYRQLLKDVCRRIGPGVFLSITALASWCDADSWLAGADIDEAVPMLFQMGSSSAAVLERLRTNGKFPFRGCQNSVGISVKGLDFRLPFERVYVFPDRGNWRTESMRQALNVNLP